MHLGKSTQRVGFTLVELLVVIAIIGALVAMLLPAVNLAREAAHRAACQNNLRQIGLALRNYDSSNTTFPSGAISHRPDTETAPLFGFSWHVAILPFMEQGSLFNTLDLTGEDASGQVGLISQDNNATNGQILAGHLLEYLWCPSSSLPQWVLTDTTVPGPAGAMSPCYVGIAGAVDHRSAVDHDSGSGTSAAKGIQSLGGVLPAHLFISSTQIRDGLSQTIAVGEQSDWCYDSSGQRIDCRSDGGLSFIAGAAPPASSDTRCFNITTVRYPVDTYDADLVGIATQGGSNRPINAPHKAGAHILLAGGEVQMLANTIDPQVLYNLSNRDDGNVIPSF